MPGWKILVRIMDGIKDSLKPNFNIEGSDDEFFKSYGMRSVVYDIVSDQMDTIINRVNNAKEVVTEARDRSQNL
jgi:hypothetical protein